MTFAETTEKVFIKRREKNVESKRANKKRKKKISQESCVWCFALDREKKKSPEFFFLSFFLVKERISPVAGGGWRERCVNDEATWVKDGRREVGGDGEALI